MNFEETQVNADIYKMFSSQLLINIKILSYFFHIKALKHRVEFYTEASPWWYVLQFITVYTHSTKFSSATFHLCLLFNTFLAEKEAYAQSFQNIL